MNIDMLAKRWISLMKPIFRPGASITSKISNGLIFEVYWKLHSNPHRPNKPSRLIHIYISEEEIEDCTDFVAADNSIKAIVEAKLQTFNPEHDNLESEGPPVERWIINL